MPSRARLDRETVVATAEQLVDRDGWAYLTMTALATKLGVRGPSLYSHVDGVEALLGEIQQRALRDIGNDLQRAAMGRSGPGGLRALADAQRGFARRHPGRYELAMSEPVDEPANREAGRAAGEALAAVIHSFGVRHVTNELQFTCVATLHGVLALDRAGLYRAAHLDLDAVWAEAVDLVVHLVQRAARA